jgi:hypothetical protein
MSRTWCSGSGVPGDPLRGGHEVPVEWAEVAFLPNRVGDEYVTSRARCRWCEQNRRDYLKSLDREKVKARSALSSHARRYAKRWGCDTSEARRRLIAYGWDIDVIASMFRDAKAAGLCKECRWTWDYGEHELTLDVSDPASLPVISPDSRCNVSVMCRTCNTRKQSMSLAEWRVFQAYVQACHWGLSRQLAMEFPP